MDDQALEAELRALGASIGTGPEPGAVAAAVLDRIAVEEPVPAGGRARRWMPRRLAAVAAVMLIALALTPPVRAAVSEWFDFGGVVVRPGPSEPSASAPPAASSGLTLADARELVAFEPVRPAELGEPDAIEVSADHRLLTMTWGSGDDTVRLDQFDGRPSPMFAKTALLGDTATLVAIGDGEGWWFAEPHDLVILDENGMEQTHGARVAAPTLIWVVDDVSLRLEGLGRDRAVEIAAATLGTG